MYRILKPRHRGVEGVAEMCNFKPYRDLHDTDIRYETHHSVVKHEITMIKHTINVRKPNDEAKNPL